MLYVCVSVYLYVLGWYFKLLWLPLHFDLGWSQDERDIKCPFCASSVVHNFSIQYHCYEVSNVRVMFKSLVALHLQAMELRRECYFPGLWFSPV